MQCSWKKNAWFFPIIHTFVLNAIFCFEVYDASCTHQQTMTTRRFVCTIVILSAKLTWLVYLKQKALLGISVWRRVWCNLIQLQFSRGAAKAYNIGFWARMKQFMRVSHTENWSHELMQKVPLQNSVCPNSICLCVLITSNGVVNTAAPCRKKNFTNNLTYVRFCVCIKRAVFNERPNERWAGANWAYRAWYGTGDKALRQRRACVCVTSLCHLQCLQVLVAEPVHRCNRA